MGILDDWDSMDVNFVPQSGSDAFGGGFSDDVLFGGSGGDRLKPDAGLELLTPQERSQLTWEEQRQLIAERSAKIAAENGGGDNVKNPLAEVLATPPSQPNYMSSETGQSISPNDQRLQTPAFDRVFGKSQQQPEQFGPPMPNQSPNPMLDLANNPSLGQPQQPTSNDPKSQLRDSIVAEATRAGINPLDLATAMSYETAGTFDPWKKGPTTKWGEHRGLIQWGEPQREKYGIGPDTPIPDQVKASVDYLIDRGVKPGMGLMDIYSAINAGGVGRYGASDAAAGGAPGTVADKVNYQMAGHRDKAAALLGMDPSIQISNSGERVQVADAGNRFAPGVYAGGSTSGVAPGSMPGPRTQGSPRMDGNGGQSGSSEEDRIQAALRAYGGGNGGGGLFGGNSDMMRAIGLSLLSSPRQAPLQNLGQNLALAEKQGESAQTEKAATAMAAYLGIDPRLAPLAAKNPQLLQMILQDRTRKQNAATGQSILGSAPPDPSEVGGSSAPPANSPPPALNSAPPMRLRTEEQSIQPDVIGTPGGYQWSGPGSQAEPLSPPPTQAPPPAPAVAQAPQITPPAPEAPQSSIRVAQAQTGAASDVPAAVPVPTRQEIAQVVGSAPPVKEPSEVGPSSQTVAAQAQLKWAMRAMVAAGAMGDDPMAKGIMEVAKTKAAIATEYLKPTEVQKLLNAAGISERSAMGQQLLRAAADKRDPAIQKAEFAAPGNLPRQREIVGNSIPDSRTTGEREAELITKRPEMEAPLLKLKREGARTAEGTEDAERGKGVAKALNEAASDFTDAKKDMAIIQRLQSLLADAKPGVGTAAAEELRRRTGIAIDPNADKVQATSALIEYLVPRQKVPGGGTSTDRDMASFRESLVSLKGTPEGNKLVIQTMGGIAQLRLEQAQIAQDWQTGDITSKEALKRMRDMPDPFESFRAWQASQAKDGKSSKPAGDTKQPERPESNSNIPRLQDNTTGREMFKRLKSGDRFIDPNGEERIKP